MSTKPESETEGASQSHEPGKGARTTHLRALPAYLGAGVVATGSHYACTIAAVEALGATPLVGSMAGFAVGATVKYLLNYFVAFRSDEHHAAAAAKYALSLALFFGMNATIFWALNSVAGLHYMLAQVLTTGLLIPPGYVVSRGWVFSRGLMPGNRVPPC